MRLQIGTLSGIANYNNPALHQSYEQRLTFQMKNNFLSNSKYCRTSNVRIRDLVSPTQTSIGCLVTLSTTGGHGELLFMLITSL